MELTGKMKVIIGIIIVIIIILVYNFECRKIIYHKNLIWKGVLLDTLSLRSIVSKLDSYVIIKMNDYLPYYKINQDIDIITLQLNKNVNIICNSYDKSLFFHKILIINNKHKQIDLYLKEYPTKLHFKFDLYSTLQYKKFNLNPNIINYIVNNRIIDKYTNMYVPRLIDDLSIRYAEYIEYKNKKKHLDYVNNYKHIDFYRIKTGEIFSNLNYNSGLDVYQSFIIWSNGYKHKHNIINIIRKEIDCRLIYIKKIYYNDIYDYIKLIYKKEINSGIQQHINSKTRYLQELNSKSFYIIIIKKYDYNPIIKNNIELDKDIYDIKWIIREMYNPRHSDKNYHITSDLSNGISHHHVIHASDNEEESNSITKLILNREINYFDDKLINKYYFPFHLNINYKTKFFIKSININDLYCNIVDYGLVNIRDTPHYRYVIGDKNIYIDYWEKNMGEKLTQDHSPYNFDNLINNFDPKMYNYNTNNLIIIDNNNIVQDGCHRLSILIREVVYIKVIQLQ
jgi:hypothetical protein